VLDTLVPLSPAVRTYTTGITATVHRITAQNRCVLSSAVSGRFTLVAVTAAQDSKTTLVQ
jgi:hypothetical protein